MKEFVAVQDLTFGMFVEDLDRPWLGTPFEIEGFLIETDEQLEQLRRFCRYVQVDRSRSAGEHPRDRHGSTVPLRRPPLPRALPWGTEHDGQRGERRLPDFLTILTRVRRGVAREEAGDDPHSFFDGLDLALPEPDTLDQMVKSCSGSASQDPSGAYPVRTTVEQELIAVAPAFHEAAAGVERLLRDIERSGAPDVKTVRTAVSTVVHSVVRNPDALMWLTRLRRADQYAFNHSLDVAVHLALFGRFVGLPLEAIELLATVGLMQDFGLANLPAGLLQKPGTLTAAEKKVVAEHVRYSTGILRERCGASEKVVEIVARHHERIDGSGYPLGLRGDSIGVYGEMAGIVDAYCAMLSPRPYRGALSSEEALKRVNQLRNRKFSEQITDQLIQCVGLYPVGTLVELETGEVGVVIAQNRQRRLRPRLMLLLGADKKKLECPSVMNLLRDPVSPRGTPYVIRQGLPPDAYGINPREYCLA